ncbi:MAG: hypothetical protein A2408_00710 [Candidatus Yonathbacteria bacterium RIFOXYC1_FULL_52_10]|uniref:Lnb N-terminal periplasmic domain-containing protein n=1 Tax=Candidatus Yonathbacteria bacterium RIFOXYD1_FULL_52_36 TaxID=1802730 RepID=A0A1G2SIJ9_9BACT|nr:MAG: hypothetical protein A2408_00710 [Candidatus Yonathbacteria bacterium RIFOXYC1_FULL_52_10]OHA84830.1 MAG: hypothetical protein A2591_00650 [Candidatus Yonathbacteria bacterium RIFOXYD1_FULL_52_36]
MKKRIALKILLVLIALFVLWSILVHPSNDRDWNADQAILPTADIMGDTVAIRNIRNFSYASTTSYTPAYYDKTFDVSKLVRAYYIVEPFSGYAGAAHTFLSFEFEDTNGKADFVAISVEIRKEKGESFSAGKGLLKQYEIMYVIADERDVVKLRSNYRKDQVFVYPVKADIENIRAVFLDMVTRANTLAEKPEFYNTLTNTCTTNIVSHVNKISPKRVSFDLSILFPENSDKLAYDLGLIDTELSFEEARKTYLINERAEQFANDPDFSLKIRGR